MLVQAHVLNQRSFDFLDSDVEGLWWLGWSWYQWCDRKIIINLACKLCLKSWSFSFIRNTGILLQCLLVATAVVMLSQVTSWYHFAIILHHFTCQLRTKLILTFDYLRSLQPQHAMMRKIQELTFIRFCHVYVLSRHCGHSPPLSIMPISPFVQVMGCGVPILWAPVSMVFSSIQSALLYWRRRFSFQTLHFKFLFLSLLFIYSLSATLFTAFNFGIFFTMFAFISATLSYRAEFRFSSSQLAPVISLGCEVWNAWASAASHVTTQNPT